MARTARIVVMVGVAASALVTACSSGTTASPTTEPAAAGDSTSADSAPAASATSTSVSEPEAGEPDPVAFSQCMRDNGVTDFPDPGPDGISLSGLGIDPESPEFKAAQDGVRPPPAATGRLRAQRLRFRGRRGVGEGRAGRRLPCADGSEFAFWERQADPTKVVFFLNGGGVCWDATTCAFTSDDSRRERLLRLEPRERRARTRDRDLRLRQRRQPVRRLLASSTCRSCTGDAHLGDATREYSPELTVQHNGYVNGTAALDHLARALSRRRPGRRHRQDRRLGRRPPLRRPRRRPAPRRPGHGVRRPVRRLRPTTPTSTPVLDAQWGAYDAMPDWEVNEGLTARRLGPATVLVQAGRHDPDLVLARFDFAYDPKRRRR